MILSAGVTRTFRSRRGQEKILSYDSVNPWEISQELLCPGKGGTSEKLPLFNQLKASGTPAFLQAKIQLCSVQKLEFDYLMEAFR